MIWLTWRQARTQTLVTLALLVAAAAGLTWLGLALRDAYDTQLGGCATCASSADLDAFRARFGLLVTSADLLLIVLPAVVGVFWGAPLVARELETGTHRLVWSQSITRTHWLAVKLGLLGLFALVTAGLLSLLLTWAASPWDLIMGNRFGAVEFASRNLVPAGYAVFGFVLGVVSGLLIRRTVPAMALTLAVFAVVQVLVPLAVRPNLRAPVTEQVRFDAEQSSKFSEGLGINRAGQVMLEGYKVPGAWMLNTGGGVQALYQDGTAPAKDTVDDCFMGEGPDRAGECLEALNLYLTLTYQPGDRYWTFQWLELSGFLVLTLLAAGLAFWRVSRPA